MSVRHKLMCRWLQNTAFNFGCVLKSDLATPPHLVPPRLRFKSNKLPTSRRRLVNKAKTSITLKNTTALVFATHKPTYTNYATYMHGTKSVLWSKLLLVPGDWAWRLGRKNFINSRCDFVSAWVALTVTCTYRKLHSPDYTPKVLSQLLMKRLWIRN